MEWQEMPRSDVLKGRGEERYDMPGQTLTRRAARFS